MITYASAGVDDGGGFVPGAEVLAKYTQQVFVPVYSTVSMEAVFVILEVIPIDLFVKVMKAIYLRKAEVGKKIASRHGPQYSSAM